MMHCSSYEASIPSLMLTIILHIFILTYLRLGLSHSDQFLPNPRICLRQSHFLVFAHCSNMGLLFRTMTKKVSEYDQEIPQSQTADKLRKTN